MLVNIDNKQQRQSVESSIISNYNPIKQRPDFFNIGPYLVKLVQRSII